MKAFLNLYRQMKHARTGIKDEATSIHWSVSKRRKIR